MKKGDLAFFSHSNCKEPGIVGVMEIVREHEPDRTSSFARTHSLLPLFLLLFSDFLSLLDLTTHPAVSAHDPKSAYYDPKSTAAAPKWSVVHVEFRRKFAAPVTLKEMRAHAGAGAPLEGMQMMKQSRLSVSRVSEAEWAFLMGLAEAKGAQTK